MTGPAAATGFYRRPGWRRGPTRTRLSVWIDAALHWGLKVTNRAAVPVDFKAAFPHLSGLAISAEPAEDYFFYPLGCVVSHAPALIRKGYGDYQSLVSDHGRIQPQTGSGPCRLECTDSDGRYKVLALRNCVPGKSEIAANHPICDTPEEFQWTNSLDVVPGVGLTWEYSPHARPGQSFAAPDVALQAHAGDWHVAMRQYAQWCHTIWKYRPYPLRLTPIINTVAPWIGQRHDLSRRQVSNRFSPAADRWCGAVVLVGVVAAGAEERPPGPIPTEDAHGRSQAVVVWVRAPGPGDRQADVQQQSGDYDGYNQRFGGVAAFREAIQTYRELCPLVTLYTDFLRVDYNTKCGRKWGAAVGRGPGRRQVSPGLRCLADVPGCGRVPHVRRPDGGAGAPRDRRRRRAARRIRQGCVGLLQQTPSAHVFRVGRHGIATQHGCGHQARTSGHGLDRSASGPEHGAPGLRFSDAVPRWLHHLRSERARFSVASLGVQPATVLLS